MNDNVGYCSLEACVIATYGIDDHDEKTSLLAELARLRALSEFAERIIGMAHRHNTRSHSTERAVYFTGVDCRDLVRRYESGLPLEDGNDGDRQRQELRRDDVHAV